MYDSRKSRFLFRMTIVDYGRLYQTNGGYSPTTLSMKKLNLLEFANKLLETHYIVRECALDFDLLR